MVGSGEGEGDASGPPGGCAGGRRCKLNCLQALYLSPLTVTLMAGSRCLCAENKG